MKRLGGLQHTRDFWGALVKLTVEEGVGGRAKIYPYTIFRRGLLWRPWNLRDLVRLLSPTWRRSYGASGMYQYQYPATWSNGHVGNALATGRDYLSLLISARTVCEHSH